MNKISLPNDDNKQSNTDDNSFNEFPEYFEENNDNEEGSVEELNSIFNNDDLEKTHKDFEKDSKIKKIKKKKSYQNNEINNFSELKNIYKINLNKAQEKAATTLNGPVLVLAGAGAGKTMTLTSRIINLIESGINPQNILAITFTNKAAKEMKERVFSAIKNNPKFNFPVMEMGFLPFVSTFHSLGVNILRENYKELNISKYFTIYDSADSKKTFKEVLKSLSLDPKEWDIKNISSIISKNKGKFINHKTFSKISEGNFYSETVAKIWNKYEQIKTEDKALDFDDLLLKTAELLESNKDIREHYLRKWQYIHVDEYQDTNKVQYKIIELLTCPDKKNIFAVGDDDQSIYGWRGSDIKNILNFEEDFSNTKKIFMEENYRSTKNIIEASNSVIARNKNRFPKELFTNKKAGEKITIYSAFSERDEASYIVKQVQERLEKINNEIKKNRDKKPLLTLNDFAVLYRANFQSRVLEEAFLKAGIDYQVLGTKFFDRAEVKDIMSYLRASLNQESLVDLKRIINSPKRGIGPSSVVKIFSGNLDTLPKKAKKSYDGLKNILSKIKEASNKMTASELIKFIIEESGYKKYLEDKKTDEDLERLGNIYELSKFAERYDNIKGEEAILKMIEEVALISDHDTKKDSPKKPSVKLMTIHAAKGLEFDTVFLSGAEQALFSAQNSTDKDNENKKTEEERRLFYVAMTRAKEKLYITWANTRTVYGKTDHNFIANFAEDIPVEITELSSTFGGNFESNDLLDDDDEEFLVW